MNPQKVERIIKDSKRLLCIDNLSKIANIRLHHKDVELSESFFFCPHCGVSRHYVKSLTLTGRLSLLFNKREPLE
ncbi:MAG: hypothetical protein MJ147_09725 [Clostridia bacterium]|nr:hypothetical protein [Clostridia bacterium]